MKNYYQILGIERNSYTNDIKSAYRQLALKFHPDKNNGDKFFEDRFKEIQEAYETLSDDKKKYLYDIEYDLFFNIKGPEFPSSIPKLFFLFITTQYNTLHNTNSI